MAGGVEKIRKGPWSEREDVQLVWYVGLYGERRWDFIGQVSGLNRSGKSCRLRWLNYLHPSLKRGSLSPHEQSLVLQLHSTLGNRWSKIARKLPGRTDNEIKNYWRTHMRKKAQERKKNLLLSSSSSSSLLSSISHPPSQNTDQSMEYYSLIDEGIDKEKVNDNGSCESEITIQGEVEMEEEVAKGYSMDKIWKEIASQEIISNEGDNFSCPSPVGWGDPYSSLWKMDDEEFKLWLPMGDLYASNFPQERES